MLLDLAVHFRERSLVVLLEEGPLRARLERAGVRTAVLGVAPALRRVRRESSLREGWAVLPEVVRLGWRVAKLARGHDLIFANTQKALVVGAAAAALARKPLVWYLHDILSPDHFSRTQRGLVVRLANRCARRVIANSQATAAAFVEAGGRADRVGVVYNGIDLAPFTDRADGEALEVRQTLGLADVPLIGVFSRLAPWKGQHVVLEALPYLPEVHALVVGDALFGEAQYAAGLRQQAHRLGVQGRVHFLGFRHDVAALMRACDVVVHSSVLPEPFGRVVVEAMLAGRPVVASAAGGVREIVEDRVTGLLVPPGDALALAAAVRELLTRPEWARAIARAGRLRATERFSLPVALEAIERELREALEGGAQGAP